MTLELSAEQAREVAKLRKHASHVRCAIVGAVAVKHHVPLPRYTGDVDLVVNVGVAELQALLPALGWKQHRRIKQRWIQEEGAPWQSELAKGMELPRFDSADRVTAMLTGFRLGLADV